MSTSYTVARVPKIIEAEVDALYEKASKNIRDQVSGQFSGGRIGTTERWRVAKTICVLVSGHDEDAMRVKEEYGSRLATRIYGIVQDGQTHVVRDRFTQIIPLIRLSMVEGGEAQLELNARFSTARADYRYAPYVPSAQMGHEIATTLNGIAARPEAVLGLYDDYKNAITSVMLGATVAEAFSGLMIPEHILESGAELSPEYTIAGGR